MVPPGMLRKDGLRRLQHAFQAHVLHGDGGMIEQVAAIDESVAATRLAIYANAYRLRLLEALRTDYPAVHTLAGDEMFERLGRAYIDAHPSTHYSIRYFGQFLSDYLKETPGYRQTPVLAEMAALEWSLTLAFDATDSVVLDEAALGALPPESWPGMRLEFHSSLQRHDFHWNVPELWRAIDQQGEPQAPAAYPQPRAWIVWRHELQNFFRPLEPAEACALDSLRGGTDFATVCAALCDWIEPAEVGLRAAGFLKGWVRAGLVTEIF